MPSTTQAPTREAVLTLLMRLGEATAAQLAEALSVSVQAMRRHLRSLEEEGVLEASPTPEGPGRPSNHWRLTRQGHDSFPDSGENFAIGLLQSMAASMPRDAIQTLLKQQAVAKASVDRRLIGEGSLTERVQRLVELRRREGYMTECRRDGDGLSWCMSEFHCSVSRIADQFPLICDQELQQMRHTFPDCTVERVHWRLEGGHSCGFRLTPRPPAAHPCSSDPPGNG